MVSSPSKGLSSRRKCPPCPGKGTFTTNSAAPCQCKRRRRRTGGVAAFRVATWTRTLFPSIRGVTTASWPCSETFTASAPSNIKYPSLMSEPGASDRRNCSGRMPTRLRYRSSPPRMCRISHNPEALGRCCHSPPFCRQLTSLVGTVRGACSALATRNLGVPQNNGQTDSKS